MKDKGIDRGLVQDFNTSKRGESKHWWGFRKMFWTYLNKLNVPFYDACCTEAPETLFPVQFNATTGGLERFNGTAWVAADDTVGSISTGLTAFSGGGQASGTALTPGYNEITTSAVAGDSVKLPAAAAGKVVTVKNDGATAIDVFPATGDTINDGSANAAIRVSPGSTVGFVSIDATNWEASNQVLGSGDGAVGAPSMSFATQPDMGLYKVSATEVGVSVSGAKSISVNASGLVADHITEKTSGFGLSLDKPIIRQPGTAKAVNTTGAITAAELAGGFITSTSAATVTATLPTAALLATQLAAVRGTIFEFVVDNSAGANTVTVAVNTGITVGTTALTGGDSLTVSTAQVVATFRLVFTTTTTAILRRIS